MDAADPGSPSLSSRTVTSESSAKSTIYQSCSEPPAPKHTFEGHKDRIESFVFLHDNVHIVTGSWDGTLRKWNCETGVPVGGPWCKGEKMIHVLSLSPDGKMVACGRGDGSIEKWETDGEMVEGTWRGHRDWVRSLSWSPSGGHIASGSDDGTILIRKVENGQVEIGPIETKQHSVASLAYSPSGERIASGGYHTICIWNSGTGDVVVGPIEDLGYDVTSVVWSLDGSRLYSADKFARVFDSLSGAELHCFQPSAFPNSIALSPKHSLLAYGGKYGARLCDTASHQPLGYPLSRSEDRHILYCLSFSPDGQYLAYSGYSNKVILWMVEDIVPEIESRLLSSVRVQVDTTRPFAQIGGGITEDEHPNILSGPSEPYRLSVAHSSSHASQRPHFLSPWRLWNAVMPSRYHRLAGEPNQPNGRPRPILFARRMGPRPVTVSAGRLRRFYWQASRHVVLEENVHANIQATSSPTAANQSTPRSQVTQQVPHRHQSQPAVQPIREEYNYGCWNKFWSAVCCCLQRRPRRTASAV